MSRSSNSNTARLPSAETRFDQQMAAEQPTRKQTWRPKQMCTRTQLEPDTHTQGQRHAHTRESTAASLGEKRAVVRNWHQNVGARSQEVATEQMRPKKGKHIIGIGGRKDGGTEAGMEAGGNLPARLPAQAWMPSTRGTGRRRWRRRVLGGRGEPA